MTAELEKANGPKEMANRVKAIPMGRLGTEKEVAEASLFLASDEVAYITGQSIIVMVGRFCQRLIMESFRCAHKLQKTKAFRAGFFRCYGLTGLEVRAVVSLSACRLITLSSLQVFS